MMLFIGTPSRPPKRSRLPPHPALEADLLARLVEERDMPLCLELLRGHAAYPDDVLADLPSTWRRLRDAEALNTMLIEARSPDGRASPAAFGMSVFVTDEWQAEAWRAWQPYLTARTLLRDASGPSVILRPSQFRQANVEGLNVLLLHYAEAGQQPPAVRPAVRYRMFQALVESLRGYRVKSLLQEFWDEIEPEFIVNGWGRIVSDYGDYFRRQGESARPTGTGPLLVGVRREDVLENPGTMAGPIFVYVPPRFGFTPAERRLLVRALAGLTDEELAQALGIRLATIKSRWRSIYDRVGRHGRDLLPAVRGEAGQAARGREKRRRLMAYLQRHPEELRPGTTPLPG